MVASLASQWNLPMPLVEQAVKERLGTARLPAKLRSGVLYTEAYDKTQTARLRGVLAAVTRPGRGEEGERGKVGADGRVCVCGLCCSVAGGGGVSLWPG